MINRTGQSMIRKWALCLPLGFASIFSSNCGLLLGTHCDDDQVVNHESPGGEYVAATFRRNCGATTEYVFLVNLRHSERRFDGQEGVVFSTTTPDAIEVGWTGPNELAVHCAGCSAASVFERATTWERVAVTY